MANVDINVDRRTDGQKIGRLYRTLLQAGAIKRSIIFAEKSALSVAMYKQIVNLRSTDRDSTAGFLGETLIWWLDIIYLNIYLQSYEIQHLLP